MSEELFRKKSLEKIKSPESMNDYIRVTNPGIWLLLTGVLVLLAGACIWGICGRIESTVPAFIRVTDGVAVCYVQADEAAAVEPGMRVEFENRSGVLLEQAQSDENGSLYILQTDVPLEPGTYVGKVIVQRFRPISFVLN